MSYDTVQYRGSIPALAPEAGRALVALAMMSQEQCCSFSVNPLEVGYVLSSGRPLSLCPQIIQTERRFLVEFEISYESDDDLPEIRELHEAIVADISTCSQALISGGVA